MTSVSRQLFSVKAKSNTPKENLRVQLAEQILSASSHEHKKPQFVFRPPPVRPNIDEIVQGRLYKTLFAALDGSVPNGDKVLTNDVWTWQVWRQINCQLTVANLSIFHDQLLASLLVIIFGAIIRSKKSFSNVGHRSWRPIPSLIWRTNLWSW